MICHFKHWFLFKLTRLYQKILSYHNRLENTDKTGLVKVRILLSILDQKSTFCMSCWGEVYLQQFY